MRRTRMIPQHINAVRGRFGQSLLAGAAQPSFTNGWFCKWRFTSKPIALLHRRFTPVNGHRQIGSALPLRAKSGPRCGSRHRHRLLAFSTDFESAAPAFRRILTCNWKPIASSTLTIVVKFWFLWIACKRTMNACPRNPRFLRKVRNIVKVGGRANGMTDFGNIRFLERFIYEIGSRASRSRLWASCAPDRFFGHVIPPTK